MLAQDVLTFITWGGGGGFVMKRDGEDKAPALSSANSKHLPTLTFNRLPLQPTGQ